VKFGVYRKVKPRPDPPQGHVSTGVGMLYQFLLLARSHYDGSEVVVYIPLRIEPEWAGTIRPCWMPRADFEDRFEFAGEGLPAE
jgi:hypothetical protein